MDIREGGTSFPYWMEDPFIKKEYDETLAREGVMPRMDAAWYAPGAKVKSMAD
jgi:hypothetical protein